MKRTSRRSHDCVVEWDTNVFELVKVDNDGNQEFS